MHYIASVYRDMPDVLTNCIHYLWTIGDLNSEWTKVCNGLEFAVIRIGGGEYGLKVLRNNALSEFKILNRDTSIEDAGVFAFVLGKYYDHIIERSLIYNALS